MIHQCNLKRSSVDCPKCRQKTARLFGGTPTLPPQNQRRERMNQPNHHTENRE